MKKRKFKKTFNTRVIKQDFIYSVDALAERLKVNKQTIYIWKKEGLQPIDDNLPLMFHGTTIIAFLKHRMNARKKPCQPDEFYCFSCQLPRKVFEGKVNIIPLSKNKVNLNGECAVCRRLIYKTPSIKNLPEILKYFQSIDQP